MKINTLLLAGALMIAVATVSIPTQAATMGCLLGGGAGGYGGSRIGKGSGKTIATIAGTLLGCAVGSKIQDADQANYQRQQPQFQSRYPQQQAYVYPQQPQPQFQSRYQEFNARFGPQAVLPVEPTCPHIREYTTTVTVAGREVPAYGFACSHDGGQTWELGEATPSL